MSAPTRQPKTRTEVVGWLRMELMHGLVRGETKQSLSDRLNLNLSTINRVAKREAETIQRLAEEVANEFTGLWIAEKRNRIAEYQADVDQINRLLVDAAQIKAEYEFGDDDEVQSVKITDTATTALMRTKARILRNVGEEMGQLPARTNIQVIQPTQVVYHVSGVDLDKLT